MDYAGTIWTMAVQGTSEAGHTYPVTAPVAFGQRGSSMTPKPPIETVLRCYGDKLCT